MTKSIIFFVTALGFFWVVPGLVRAVDLTKPDTLDLTDEGMSKDSYHRGTIEKIVHESEMQELGETVLNQQAELLINSGSDTGKKVIIEYQVRGSSLEDKKLFPGQEVVVNKNETPEGVHYYVSEVFRLRAIAWLLALFFALTIFLTGRRGVMALVGLGVTMMIIGWYIVPNITRGENPLVVCLIGTSLIASSSLFLAHGFNRRTTLAFISSVITIGISLLISVGAVSWVHLFGLGSEEAYYLQYAPVGTINMRGLLLGGIIIGVMGVLDDVTTAQVATVGELKAANPKLSARELYRRANLVGREHIVSLVNTLVLAYVGASFPLLLLFTTFGTPWWVTMNTELISEELVRTIIGSLALVTAVPLTTLIAAYSYGRVKNLETI